MFSLIFGLQANNSYSQKTKITINIENSSVAEVIDHIELTTDFRFVYKIKFVDIKRNISIKAEQKTIHEILDILFKDTNTDYIIKDTLIVLKQRETIKPAQKERQIQDKIKITGKVLDQSNVPLPGASVLELGTANGAQTNFDGAFTLEVTNPNTILKISYLGYTSVEVPLNGQINIVVNLKESSESLSEIVVVGYGTQRKSDITGSVSSVSRNRLEQVPNTNFTQAIQGAVPGVNIQTTGSSADGDEINILIRGRNSFSNSRNTPLIVLDGVPYNGNMSDINPTDIASIDILKDASSAAIYGSRAANGVILITSKKGVKGQVRFSYDGLYGTEALTEFPKPMSPAEFYNFKRIRDASLLTDSEIELFENGGGTDWLDLATRTGTRQQHTLSASGGGEKTKYYISGSYLDVQGVAVNDQFKRTTLRVNLDTELTDWLKLGTNTQMSFSERDGQNASFGLAYRVNPLTTAFDEDGNLTLDPWPEDIQSQNPLHNLLYKDNYDTYKVFTNNYLDVTLPFIKGLSYRINTGVEFTSINRQQYQGRDTKNGFRDQGRAELEDNISTNVLVENLLNYNNKFGKNTIGVTALYSYQKIKAEIRTLQSRGFPSDDLTWYQAELGAVVEPGYSFSEQITLSSMLRINYNYDDRFLLTFTGRRDGYSGFGENNKWGDFLSGALGWNIHNEAFMKNSIFNTLKVRSSYGLNGNQAIGPYQTLTTLDNRPYLNGSETAIGFIPDDIGNPNLKWESTLMANIGLEYALLNNRISGSIEYYSSKTKDLLLNRTISSVSGDNAIIDNIGELTNTGLELMISGDIISNDDFRWNVSANATWTKNEITELYGDGTDDLENQWFIGRPINVAFDLEFDGVYQIGEDIASSAQPNAQPGFAKIVDQNNDGVIDDEDRAILGNEDPNFFAGFNTTITYKDFSLNIFSQGAFGAIKENDLLKDDVNSDIRRNTIPKNWWTPDNPTNEFWANNIDANLRSVDIYESIDYWRIKDITLSYVLPKIVSENIGIDNLRLYVTGRNLFTITNYTGLDPELTGSRDIPLSKSYVFGVNLSF
ncbi:TonB-dependent receptor [Flavivirga amylovorans]